MKPAPVIPRIETGIRNLDAILGGGVPKGSILAVVGPPGSGKTILTQQICFHHASPERPVLYFSTLSEPTAKTLRYISEFSFFDPAKRGEHGVQFVDLGVILRATGLEETAKLIMDQVKRVKPSIVVIDSFKVFDDLAHTEAQLRKFGYELAINLMAWETTAFLLGEYSPEDIATHPLFSIVDGLITMSQREESGEHQRFIHLVKVRGTEHSRDEHPFLISSRGIEVFAPRVTINREAVPDEKPTPRLKTFVSKLDDLLGEGIPRGSSLLIGGVAGSGKTILLLEFLYRGALKGEKGIIFSFEETEQRLRATARGLGWDLDREIARGMVQIVFIPQPNIMVEQHMLMMRERIEAMGAKRVAIDSVSVFLHKVKDPQTDREKMFQLASIVQNAQAVGFFATDIPYGKNQISRFGVEETVVDGVVLLTSTEEGFERQRYLEIYKLRNTAHLKGRHNMEIGKGGISLFPRYNAEADLQGPPPALDAKRRLSTGASGLDPLLGGGLLGRSITLISGSAGTGKSTLGVQFLVEGAKQNEHGLYVALEEGPEQMLKVAAELRLPLKSAVDAGRVELLYLSRQHVRANQFLAIISDKIRAKKVRRLVLDSVSHIGNEGLPADELQQLLFGLATRFKSLGVTSLFTLEASAMHSTDSVTDRGYSNVADNLIVLRYQRAAGELKPFLVVVKTRGSSHDRGAYDLTIGKGGVHIGPRVDGGDPPKSEATLARTARRGKGT